MDLPIENGDFPSYVSLPEGNSGVIPHFSTAVLNISMMAALVHCMSMMPKHFFLTVGQGDENQNLPRLGFFLNHRHRVGKWEQTGNQTTRGYITPP